jgi:DNA-binding GntR family transcriptional regulator
MSELPSFPPVRPQPPQHRGRLTDLAYQRLKEDIDAGVFRPGTVVKEADLVMRFNMSRTPVREAVQRLLTEGYIQQLHRGFVVVELSDTELMNIYRVRGVLEGMAARQAAASRSRVDLALLQDLHEQELETVKRGGPRDEIGNSTDAFHIALARASHNEFLISVLELARRRAEPYRRRLLGTPGMNERVMDDHQRIIEAIESGDRAGAELAARLHTRRTLRALRGGGELTEQDDIEEAELIHALDAASALNEAAT